MSKFNKHRNPEEYGYHPEDVDIASEDQREEIEGIKKENEKIIKKIRKKYEPSGISLGGIIATPIVVLVVVFIGVSVLSNVNEQLTATEQLDPVQPVASNATHTSVTDLIDSSGLPLWVIIGGFFMFIFVFLMPRGRW